MSIDEDGFFVAEEVFSHAECESISKQLATCSTRGAGTRRLLDCDWCQQLAIELRRRLPSHLKGLFAVQCTFFQKSLDCNWHVAWHQDRSIPVASRFEYPGWTRWSSKEHTWFVEPPTVVLESLVVARLQIDDSTLSSGLLKVMRKTHRRGILSPEEINCFVVDGTATDCQVRRGGVLLMSPLALHSSAKTTSRSNRRVLHFVYGPQLPPWAAWQLAV